MPPGASLQRAPEGEPQPAPSDPAPTKRDLASWWKTFKRNNKKEEEKVEVDVEEPSTGIFGVSLQTSIRYANVAISLSDPEGRSFIYGYVPIIVAKCGVFLKEKATDVEGIFRLAGAERRIKELQFQFNSPDRYGKGLDWSGYTVHDAANVLRRYLNQLPEPIIPLSIYERFREPLRHHQAQAVGEIPQQGQEIGGFDVDAAIRTYQQLITELPPLNRQLLLYLLDLLAVFAAKSDLNLMNAHNLSAIFQPGLISHPSHDMAPAEYRLSQDVLIFLIDKQDHFLVGMQGTAADEQTIQEVQSGAPTPYKPSSGPTTPKSRTQQLLGRSASTASAGSESARRLGAMRRNVSVSSKNSRQSNYAPSPVTPPTGGPLGGIGKGNGVHRSNTLPSKKSPSPALPSERFPRDRGSEPQALSPTGSNVQPRASPRSSRSTTPALPSVNETEPKQGLTFATSAAFPASKSPRLSPVSVERGRSPNQDRQKSISEQLDIALPPASGSGRVSPSNTPSRERGFGNLFKQSPSRDPEKKDGRKVNRLQKKRATEGVIVSPKSSTHSLGGGASGGSVPPSPAFPPQSSTSRRGSNAPGEGHYSDMLNRNTIAITTPMDSYSQNLPSRPFEYVTAQSSPDPVFHLHEHAHVPSGNTLKPPHSPHSSLASSDSSQERVGEAEVEAKKEKSRRWRISSSVKKEPLSVNGSLGPAAFGLAPGAQRSTSTIASMSRSRKSMTDESYHSTNALSMGPSSNGAEVSGHSQPVEKKGAFGWFRDKLQRSKSPAAAPNFGGAEGAKSKQSLNAIASGSEMQGRSVEAFGIDRGSPGGAGDE